MSQNCGSSSEELIEELSERLQSYLTDEVLLLLETERTLASKAESLHGVVIGNPGIRTVLERLSPNASCQRSAVREALRLLRARLVERFTAAEQRLELASQR